MRWPMVAKAASSRARSAPTPAPVSATSISSTNSRTALPTAKPGEAVTPRRTARPGRRPAAGLTAWTGAARTGAPSPMPPSISSARASRAAAASSPAAARVAVSPWRKPSDISPTGLLALARRFTVRTAISDEKRLAVSATRAAGRACSPWISGMRIRRVSSGPATGAAASFAVPADSVISGSPAATRRPLTRQEMARPAASVTTMGVTRLFAPWASTARSKVMSRSPAFTAWPSCT